MYVGMYVCMYVRMYVCMYVCYVCMYLLYPFNFAVTSSTNVLVSLLHYQHTLYSTNTNIRSPTITEIPTKTRDFQTSRRVDWSSVTYLTIYQKTRRNTQKKNRLLIQGYTNVPQNLEGHIRILGTRKATSS